MSDTPGNFSQQSLDTAAEYELRVEGRFGRESAPWFEDMTLQIDESTRPVQTIIRGNIRDLGLTLLSVQRIDKERKA